MPEGHVIELDSPRSPVAERWEAGSDFDFSEETGSVTLPWESQPVTLWGSGRDAIRAVFEWGQQRHGWRRLQ